MIVPYDDSVHVDGVNVSDKKIFIVYISYMRHISVHDEMRVVYSLVAVKLNGTCKTTRMRCYKKLVRS